jgi:hypothetical protein
LLDVEELNSAVAAIAGAIKCHAFLISLRWQHEALRSDLF